MIIADVKPLEEIMELLKPYKRVLNTGCGGCVAVCLAGGQKEVDTLNTRIELACWERSIPLEISGFTVERQCDMQFNAEFDRMAGTYDALMSMACGAGIQFLAERFPSKPVLPAVNTTFIGVNKEIGWYEERCQSCGDCVLGVTGGICPVTMCAKSLFNGPCGGPQDGHCEVDKDTPCAWIQIHDRLKGQGRLENILKVFPAREWQNQVQGKLLLEEYRSRYVVEAKPAPGKK